MPDAHRSEPTFPGAGSRRLQQAPAAEYAIDVSEAVADTRNVTYQFDPYNDFNSFDFIVHYNVSAGPSLPQSISLGPASDI